MNSRSILLGLAALLAAMCALPAVASAGEWSIHNATGTNPSFTVSATNPKITVNGEANWTCATVAGAGAYTSPTTGNIALTFHGCTESFSGSACTTPGQPAGTIIMGSHVFHNVHLEPTETNTNKIGMLITGGSGASDLATFECKPFGVTKTYTTTGNIIGEVTSPACGGAATTTSTVVFATKAGASEPTQQWEQVTTSGTVYDLVTDVTAFGNTTVHTAAWDSTTTFTYTNGNVTATCL
jgi:hypothetical protein